MFLLVWLRYPGNHVDNLCHGHTCGAEVVQGGGCRGETRVCSYTDSQNRTKMLAFHLKILLCEGDTVSVGQNYSLKLHFHLIFFFFYLLFIVFTTWMTYKGSLNVKWMASNDADVLLTDSVFHYCLCRMRRVLTGQLLVNMCGIMDCLSMTIVILMTSRPGLLGFLLFYLKNRRLVLLF